MNLKVILIDTYNCRFAQMRMPAEHSLEFLQALVGGLIQPVEIDEDNCLYVNEEGWFDSDLAGIVFGGQPFAGNGVIVGFDAKTGDHKSTNYTVKQAEMQIRILSREETAEYRNRLG